MRDLDVNAVEIVVFVMAWGLDLVMLGAVDVVDMYVITRS